MASIKKLNEITGTSQPQPQVAAPVKVNHVSRNADDRFKEIALHTAKKMISDSVNGDKHNQLLKAAKLLGGYIAGGFVDENEAYQVLKTAIDSKDCNDYQSAYQTIKDGLKNGQSKPITKLQQENALKNWIKENGGKVKKQPALGSRFYGNDSTPSTSPSPPPEDLNKNKVPFIRCGCDYFKVSYVGDRFIKNKKTLLHWRRGEIELDFDRNFVKAIPKYDSFVIVPDNINYQPVINNSYNLYAEFSHRPSSGNCENSKNMIRHIFGEQYELGVKYLQCLYQKPKQALPILALVSNERETGKSTFLNWLQAIFGDNMAVIQSTDLESPFNGIYASKNIIAVDETLIERVTAAERLKNISTAKRLTVNTKHVANYAVDFYGKIIMCSNKEDGIIRIDDEEVRYWIRKVNKPETDIPDYENLLIKEIPAFLNFLNEQTPLQMKSRMMFTPEEISTAQLQSIKTESMSTLGKEIKIRFTDFFENDGSYLDTCFCTAKNIKEKYFHLDHNYSASYIGSVLKNEFKMVTPKVSLRYKPFILEVTTVGKPFEFKRADFTETGTITGTITAPY